MIDRATRHEGTPQAYKMTETICFNNITENKDLVVPDGTVSISFSTCIFKTFPVIPESVRELYFDRIQILSNEPIQLHEGLELLSLGYDTGYFSTLIQKLPSTLKKLRYRKTGHGVMPALPDGLEELSLTRDHFTKYPDQFPRNLNFLDLSESAWTSLPEFPMGLESLSIWGMKMDHLPNFPSSLIDRSLYLY